MSERQLSLNLFIYPNGHHVQATNDLEGARVSSCMSSKLADYEKGRISSAELVAAAKARYSNHD